MNEEGELFPPAQYDPIWMVMIISMIVIAIIFYILVLLSTRKVKLEEMITPLPGTASGNERLSLIKNKYVKKVEDTVEAYNDGRISNRKAFQSLSILLRSFVHEYSLAGTHAMNLRDLKNASAPQLLTERIQNFYPLAFEEANRTGNVELAANDTLMVIQQWY